MEARIGERIRQGLMEKRDSLTDWLRATPLNNKETFLGPSTAQAVQAHLDAIDTAISKAESGTLGKCKVCHDEVEPELLEIDYNACVCLEHLSEEEARHLESELELAQNVQKMLLPQEAPNIPGLEVAAYSRPAQIVGGDYFDFVEFASGFYGLAIADVAGHGVSASLHMASMQSLLKALAPMSRSPAEVIRQIHKLLIHNIRYTTFVTFFIGAFDPSNKRLTFCNAGHNPPLVLRSQQRPTDAPILLKPTGAAIGLVEEADFGEDSLDLHAGDLLVLYTDGVTEAVNGNDQAFGRDRLASLVRIADHLPARDVVNQIRQGLEEFGGGRPFVDDTTFVVCRIT